MKVVFDWIRPRAVFLIGGILIIYLWLWAEGITDDVPRSMNIAVLGVLAALSLLDISSPFRFPGKPRSKRFHRRSLIAMFAVFLILVILIIGIDSIIGGNHLASASDARLWSTAFWGLFVLGWIVGLAQLVVDGVAREKPFSRLQRLSFAMYVVGRFAIFVLDLTGPLDPIFTLTVICAIPFAIGWCVHRYTQRTEALSPIHLAAFLVIGSWFRISIFFAPVALLLYPVMWIVLRFRSKQ